ncbi:alginate export family protein [Candidatus Omnitrophota bacterium]
MSKRLILVLALVLAVGIGAAYAEVQNVKVSGDLTIMGTSRMLDPRGSDPDMADTNEAYGVTERDLISITRLRVDADLTDNVSTTLRLLNERYWGRENVLNSSAGINSDITIDLACVAMKEFLYSPLTLIVGRQELHFGNDMIVGDPETNNASLTSALGSATRRDPDLSARKSFDAIRATLDYDPMVIDLVLAKLRERMLRATDDEDLYGINIAYDMGDENNSSAELYYFEKLTGRDQLEVSAVLDNDHKNSDRVQTVGARFVSEPMENLSTQIEAAYQFGKRVPLTTDLDPEGVAADTDRGTVDRKAWAIEAAATLGLPKMKYTPTVTALYAYFSGNHENNAVDNDLGTWRGWDPMYENQAFGHIANALFPQSNAHILGAVVTANIMEDVNLKSEYYNFWWASKYPEGATISTARDTGAALVMDGKSYAGQELDMTLTYDYTEDVQFGLMGGLFIPGSSFMKDNDSVMSEIIGSMKVTF